MDTTDVPFREAASSRERATRCLLWVSVVMWGVLLGAKLFDLRVLVGAWSASPPDSLSLLPYGPRYPVDTGAFFIPISALVLISSFGALISGWKTPFKYRALLLTSSAMIFTTLVFTVVAFWPRNAALWEFARGSRSTIRDTVEAITLVRQWVVLDWLRVAAGAVGYCAAVRAISVPFPREYACGPSTVAQKVLYGVCLVAVILFALYFVSNVL